MKEKQSRRLLTWLLCTCLLLSLLLGLTACGSSNGYEGTWRWTEEGDEIQMELEENGQVLYYEVHSGMLHTGVWTETEDGIDVSIDGGMTDLNFYTTDRKDALQPWWTPTLFVKTNGLEVPRASIAYLECYLWIDAEAGGTLEVGEDGSWELTDNAYTILDEGGTGSVEIDGYDITLTSGNGNELKLEVSGDSKQLSCNNGMTFVRSHILDDQRSNSLDPAEFYGRWEYQDYYVWVDIRDDGTYEWVDGDNASSGSYTMDGDELVLDNGMRLAPDGAGGLIDSDGELLFQSELPDFYYEGDDEEDYSPTVTAEDFYGCWEYTDTYTWVYIYGDGTYEWYDSEGLEVMGNYYMFGDELCLEDSGMSFTLDGSGGLVDAFGDTLFLSELPQW